MYKKISQHPGTRALYAERLVMQGILTADGAEKLVADFRAAMDEGKHNRADPVLTNYKSKFAVDWSPYLNKKWTDAADTSVPISEIKRPVRTYYNSA